MQEMLYTIEREYGWAAAETGRAAPPRRVLEAMSRVPREEFVPPAMQAYAYADNALPIGEGQTISQPFIVALMTDLLEPEADDVILEVGTGSGYQAAVLAELVRKVYSIEVVPSLAREAEQRLQRLGYRNIEVRTADGYRGLPRESPFDGIIVTAAASHVPPPLVEQLEPGGHLVIPVGRPYLPQELMVLTRDEKGKVKTRSVLGVAFVPLTGGQGRNLAGEEDAP